MWCTIPSPYAAYSLEEAPDLISWIKMEGWMNRRHLFQPLLLLGLHRRYKLGVIFWPCDNLSKVLCKCWVKVFLLLFFFFSSLGEEPTANTAEAGEAAAGEGWLGVGGKVPDEQEKLHLYFLKRVLGVSKSTPSSIVLAEFGRFPLYVYKWKQILRYWNRLVIMDENRLVKQAFNESYYLHLQGKKLGAFLF